MEDTEIFEDMEVFEEKLEKTGFSEGRKDILFKEKARSLFNSIGDNRPALAETPHSTSRPDFPDSFSSMVNRAGINQHMDFVLFAAYNKIINLGEENVNTKDINEEYQLARMKTSNTNVFLNSLIRKGLLMPQGKKDGLTAFTITRDGVKYVEERLENGN